MKFDEIDLQKIFAVLDADSRSFVQLARIAGLRPGQDFCGLDLSRVDFGTDDLSDFRFHRTVLKGANLSHARGLHPSTFAGAIWDDTTRWPKDFNARDADLQPAITTSSILLGLSDGQFAFWDFQAETISYLKNSNHRRVTGIITYGENIVAGYSDGYLYRRDILSNLTLLADDVQFAAGYDNDPNILVITRHGFVNMTDAESDAGSLRRIGQLQNVKCLHLFKGSRIAVSLTQDGLMSIWNLDQSSLVGEDRDIERISMNAAQDSSLFCTISNSQSLKLVNATSGSVHTLRKKISHNSQVTFLEDGNLLLCEPRKISVLDKTGASVREDSLADSPYLIDSPYLNFGNITACMAAEKHGALFATDEGDLALWDVSTGHLAGVSHLPKRNDIVKIETFPGCARAISVARDGTFRMWDIRKRLKEIHYKLIRITGFTFLPEHNALLLLTKKGAVQMWDVSTGRLIGKFQKGGAKVSAATVTKRESSGNPWIIDTAIRRSFKDMIRT